MTYVVTVGNTNYMGSHLGEFKTEEAAYEAGEDWLTEMCALDEDPEQAREEYEYIVTEK